VGVIWWKERVVWFITTPTLATDDTIRQESSDFGPHDPAPSEADIHFTAAPSGWISRDHPSRSIRTMQSSYLDSTD
jgi:hypothetical protein